MILITDAHISKAAGNHATFFRMLESLEGNHQDLIFLGDIFDLWVALPRYEDETHHNFVAWCREQKKYRTIGFMEGNREYFLARQRAQAFSWCSAAAWRRDDAGTLFVHGDQINRRDRNYLNFRKFVKNRIFLFILRILPFGPRMAESFKLGLKKTNMEFRLHLPLEEVKLFAESRFAEGIDTIFVGHFHQEYLYCKAHLKKLYVLPDWFGTQKVTVFDRDTKKVAFIHWEKIN